MSRYSSRGQNDDSVDSDDSDDYTDYRSSQRQRQRQRQIPVIDRDQYDFWSLMPPDMDSYEFDPNFRWTPKQHKVYSEIQHRQQSEHMDESRIIEYFENLNKIDFKDRRFHPPYNLGMELIILYNQIPNNSTKIKASQLLGNIINKIVKSREPIRISGGTRRKRKSRR